MEAWDTQLLNSSEEDNSFEECCKSVAAQSPNDQGKKRKNCQY